MIFNAAEGKLSADTFLLSCRALGRGIEHRMLAKLGQIASERGLAPITLRYHRQAKIALRLHFSILLDRLSKNSRVTITFSGFHPKLRCM